MSGVLRSLVIAAALLTSAAAAAQVQVGQTFIPEGPSPKSGPLDVVQSGDAAPNGTVSGAVQAIALDPAFGAETMFIGTPLGGVWRSTNDGATWTPLTDNQASLSIASLAVDPSDPTGKTIVAGIGVTSNGSWDNFNLNGATGRGGARTGLLYSTDGGNTWSAMGSNTLLGQSVIGVAADDSTILAATFEEQNPTQTKANGNSYGLYLSNNGGKDFSLLQPSSGLPAGPVTALVADPQNTSNCGPQQSCTFYASVTSAHTPSATGVYVSHDSGQSWSAVFTAATVVSGGTNVITGASTYQLVPKLAAGPNGSIAIAIAQLQPYPSNGDGQQLTGLYLSQNDGSSWSALKVPATNKGVMQAAVNLAIAIDPKNTSIVYVTGDGIPNTPYTVPAFRVQGQSAISLTLGQTSNDSTAHSDSRALVIDASGNLWMGSDGGIYMRSNPESNSGSWTGANTATLQIAETYSVAYDSLTNRLATAMQDAGAALQSQPGSPLWSALTGADGVQVAFNSTFGTNKAAVYYSTDSLGYFNRLVFDGNGNQLSPATSGFGPGTSINCSYDGSGNGCNAYVPDPNIPGQTVNNSAFSAPFVLNKTDPTKIAIAPGYANFNGVNGNIVYVGRDTSDATAQSVNLQMTGVGTIDNGSTVLQLAYGMPSNNNQGTSTNPDALLAGVQTANFDGQLWFSPDVTQSPLSQLTAYTGLAPTAMVLDPTSPSAQSSPGQIRFYIADAANLWGTTNQGSTFSNLTSNLPVGFDRPTAVDFISNNGVNALLVGGLNSPLICNNQPNGCVIGSQQSPITVADSDSSGNLSGWRAFGQGLPNSWVVQLAYYPDVDVLAVGTAGRGVYALYDVTSYFKQATTLQFGLANNDLIPDASVLTDGTTLGGTAFSRPLIKYGTGTLQINGNATYSGTTTINGGTIALGDGVNTGSLLGSPDVITTSGTHIVVAPGVLIPGEIAGNISGPGDFTHDGPGAFILLGDNSYGGGTTLNGGTLIVGNNNALGTGTLAMAAGTTLSFLNPGNFTVANQITIAGDPSFAPPAGTTQTLSGVIADGGSPGTLNMDGAGTLVLSGINTYSGPTIVTSGMLDVTGSIASSSLTTVASGAALIGSGTVGNLQVNAGSMFAPGSATPGTSTAIAGSLAFQSGALYVVYLNQTTSTFASVTGTASLAGTVEAMFAPGSNAAKQYTILQSANLNGTTFTNLTTNNANPNFNETLSYSASDVFLNVSAALGQGSALNDNRQNVATAINNFSNSGGTLPEAFSNLFNLTGSGLANSLTQLDGEDGDGAEHAAFELTNDFLGLMLDPFVYGRGGVASGGGPLGFAPDQDASIPSDVALAYAGF